MKSLRKQLVALFLSIIILLGIGFVASAEANPITITATAVENGVFTVYIHATAGTDMQAFWFAVEYDSQKIAVVGEKGEGYGFTSQFTRMYNADNSAVFAYNNLDNTNHARLIFTGAQAYPEQAKLNKSVEVTFIRFQLVNSNADTAEIAEALAGIYLRVEQLKGAEGDLVELYPDAFQKRGLLVNHSDVENQNASEAGEALEADSSEQGSNTMAIPDVGLNVTERNQTDFDITQNTAEDGLNRNTEGTENKAAAAEDVDVHAIPEADADATETSDALTKNAATEEGKGSTVDAGKALAGGRTSKKGYTFAKVILFAIMILALLAYIGKRKK